MVEVKANYKGKYETYECDLCKEEEETQEHLLKCRKLNKNMQDAIKLQEYKKILEGNVKNQL